MEAGQKRSRRSGDVDDTVRPTVVGAEPKVGEGKEKKEKKNRASTTSSVPRLPKGLSPSLL